MAKRALFDAYLYLGSHSFDSEALLDFLASRTVFIQKVELPTDSSGNFVRPLGKTRRLTLSNTDMKNISSAAACTLGKIATSCISDVQLGGVRGRQMIDHIIRMESRLLEFIARKLPRAGIIALDQAAAFPSISRRFLFWVLRRMRIPKGLYRLLVNLHKPTRTFVCLRNLLLDFFEVSGGVKQGDPAAMVLFVIAFDPLIKFVSSCLSIERCYCFGYCDDLGIASENIISIWPILKKCFRIITSVSALQLNVDKNQFLFSDFDNLDALSLELIEADPLIAGEQIRKTLKYLGIYLGSNTADLNWAGPLKKFVDAISFLCTLDCGLTTLISLYNLLALSKLSFVGSFFPPTARALDLEKWSIQKLLRGPWNAIPSSALYSFKQLGLPTQVRPLVLTSGASVVRAANLTSSCFFVEVFRLQSLVHSTDLTLRAAAGLLFCNSFFQHWIDTSLEYDAKFLKECPARPITPGFYRQKNVYKRLLDHFPTFDFVPFLTRRLGFFFEDDLLNVDAQRILSIYRFLASHTGPRFITTHLRTVANHWCTSSRFGRPRSPCHFCGLFGGEYNDRVFHSLTCPVFNRLFLDFHRLTFNLFDISSLLRFRQLGAPLSLDASKLMVYYTFVAFRVYNRCRHGHILDRRLLCNTIKTVVTKSRFAWKIRRDLVRFGYCEMLAD